MNKKSKFYVVLEGRTKGIFKSWEECREQVHGFENSRYKSFNTLEQAEEAFEKGKFAASQAKSGYLFANKEKPVCPSICVDAACSVDKQLMEYRGVFWNSGKVLFHKGPFEGATNNIGEFLAIVHALAFMQKNELNYPVYSDSITALSWVLKKRINTKIQPGPKVQTMIDKALLWLNKNTKQYTILKWDTSHWGEIPADFGRK